MSAVCARRADAAAAVTNETRTEGRTLVAAGADAGGRYKWRVGEKRGVLSLGSGGKHSEETRHETRR